MFQLIGSSFPDMFMTMIGLDLSGTGRLAYIFVKRDKYSSFPFAFSATMFPSIFGITIRAYKTVALNFCSADAQNGRFLDPVYQTFLRLGRPPDLALWRSLRLATWRARRAFLDLSAMGKFLLGNNGANS